MAIVIGEDNSIKKECTCQKCAARIAYAPQEVQNFWSGTDYGGGPDGADGIICPRCGSRVITYRW